MTRLGVVVFAAVFTQGCVGALFPLIMVPGVLNTPKAECDACKVDAAHADRLADGVPYWMEESRLSAGPTATADRVGFYSWEISLAGTPVSRCMVRLGDAWHCDPLEAPAPTQL